MDLHSLPATPTIRPREKLASMGPQALSDVELIMILLGSGCARKPVDVIAHRLRDVLGTKRQGLSLADLREVEGIGLAKASAVLAAFELSRRHMDQAILKIRSADDVLPLLHDIRKRNQEHFVVISLNGNHEVLHTRVVTVGLANFCQVHPREVFADVLQDRATAVVLAHNHPSGNLEPSSEDISVTRRLVSSAGILGITVLDHVIVSGRGFCSLREREPMVFRGVG